MNFEFVGKDLVVTDARIAFKNFSGKPTTYTAEGTRTFCLILEDEIAEACKQLGWNIKQMLPKEEGAPIIPYVNVTAKYGDYPPQIWKVTSRGRTLLDEETVGTLDWADIVKVDLKISPWHWQQAGREGVKLFVSNMFVTINEDPLELLYQDIPEAPKENMI